MNKSILGEPGLGLKLEDCDGIYPRTRDGRCMGCGTMTSSEDEHRKVHWEAHGRSRDDQ